MMACQKTLTNAKPVWSRNLDKNAFIKETTSCYTDGEVAAMRKAFPAAVFILTLLLSAVAGIQFVGLAAANPLIEERYDSPPIVSINSPANGAYVNSVLLNVTVTKPEDWLSTPISFSYEAGSGLSQKLVSVSFYVDGKFYGSVAANSNLVSPFQYSLYLTDIADGSHTLVVHADSTGVVRNWISSTVYSVPVDSSIATAHFTLDSTPPHVSFLSTETAYATSDFPLNFTVNEPVSEISYVLAGQENVTVAGNTTLTGLSYGTHNLTVHTTDAYGNAGASEPIYFTITEPEPEPFPTTLVIAPTASVAVVGAGLLVYFKKRRR
jgi:hypothetical protein